jgi:hypothetical protein
MAYRTPHSIRVTDPVSYIKMNFSKVAWLRLIGLGAKTGAYLMGWRIQRWGVLALG